MYYKYSLYIKLFTQCIYILISYLDIMVTHIYVISIKKKSENIISGFKHLELSENTTTETENITKNVFMTLFLLINLIIEIYFFICMIIRIMIL